MLFTTTAIARPPLVDCHDGINHIVVSRTGRIAVSDVHLQVTVSEGGEDLFSRSFRSVNDKVRSTERVRSMAFSPDGDVLYVVAGEAISAHNMAGEELWEYVPPRSFGFLIISPVAVDVAENGLLGVAFDNGSMGVWNPNGTMMTLWRDNDAPRWLRALQGGRTIVGSDSFSLCQWSTESRQKLKKVRLPDRCYGTAFAPAHNLVAVRTLHCVLVYDMESGQLVGQASVNGGLPLLDFHPSKPILLLGDRHAAHLVDLQGNPLATYETEGRRLVSLAFSASGSTLYLGCDDGTLVTHNSPAL